MPPQRGAPRGPLRHVLPGGVVPDPQQPAGCPPRQVGLHGQPRGSLPSQERISGRPARVPRPGTLPAGRVSQGPGLQGRRFHGNPPVLSQVPQPHAADSFRQQAGRKPPGRAPDGVGGLFGRPGRGHPVPHRPDQQQDHGDRARELRAVPPARSVPGGKPDLGHRRASLRHPESTLDVRRRRGLRLRGHPVPPRNLQPRGTPAIHRRRLQPVRGKRERRIFPTLLPGPEHLRPLRQFRRRGCVFRRNRRFRKHRG
mmetsp:Transcript_112414/g.230153  ORF Transcript_112414/g.230153 Transcript_112414/m.230153 type:complete len:255 (-) Transcript_112414:2285-3049(-)